MTVTFVMTVIQIIRTMLMMMTDGDTDGGDADSDVEGGDADGGDADADD